MHLEETVEMVNMIARSVDDRRHDGTGRTVRDDDVEDADEQEETSVDVEVEAEGVDDDAGVESGTNQVGDKRTFVERQLRPVRRSQSWSVLSDKDVARMNERHAYLTEEPGVNYHRPGARAECESLPKLCPWCSEIVVMVVDRPDPEDVDEPDPEDVPVVPGDVKVKCPSCSGLVRYRGEVRAGVLVWGWLRYVPGDAVDPRGLPHCRPCIHVGCRHHLFLEVRSTTHGPSMKMNFPGVGPEDLFQEDTSGLTSVASCSLDVAAAGGASLEEIGDVMNVTRERVRQIEDDATKRVRASRRLRALLMPPEEEVEERRGGRTARQHATPEATTDDL